MQNTTEIINKAISLQKGGKLKEAEDYLENYIQKNESDNKIYIALCSIYEARKKRKKAIDILDTAILKFPNDPLLLTNYGGILIRDGNSKKAISYLEKACVLSPTTIINYINLSCAYAETRDWKRAAATAEIVLSHDPNSSFMLKLLAQSSIETQNYSRCLAAYDKLSDIKTINYKLTSDPKNKNVINNYDRKNPSPRYFELSSQYEKIHKQSIKEEKITFAGLVTFLRIAPYIRNIFKNKKIISLLDYGGGQGKQYLLKNLHNSKGDKFIDMQNYLDIKTVNVYDAGRPETLKSLGQKYDAVICTDVLEHCDELDLPWIINELFEHSTNFVFATIATYPAVKILPNGENAHCTIKNSDWWSSLFSQIALNHPGIKYAYLVVNDKSLENVEGFTNYKTKV